MSLIFSIWWALFKLRRPIRPFKQVESVPSDGQCAFCCRSSWEASHFTLSFALSGSQLGFWGIFFLAHVWPTCNDFLLYRRHISTFDLALHQQGQEWIYGGLWHWKVVISHPQTQKIDLLKKLRLLLLIKHKYFVVILVLFVWLRRS